MKAGFFATVVFGTMFGLMANMSLRAEEPDFEEIEIIRTNLEPCGEMLNCGDGYFYGAARWVEKSPGGAIFRVAPHQATEVLYTFPNLEWGPQPNYGGSNPSCGLVLGPDGAFYGGTDNGGAYGYGTIFRISVDGVFSVVYDFRDTDGQHVQALVAASTGELYGVTRWGGALGGGTLFQIGTDGIFQVVHQFNSNVSLPGGALAAPFYPQRLHEGLDGRIYGTTTLGGPIHEFGAFRFTYGTFFRYDGPNAITVLANFDSLLSSPGASAVASDGFYITTELHLVHILFDGTTTLETTFPLPKPYTSSLLVMPDGVYGLADYAGANQSGFVYRFVSGEGTTILHDFTTEYAYRRRCLVPGNDDLVYGLAAFPEGYVSPAASSGSSSSSSGSVTFTGAGTLVLSGGSLNLGGGTSVLSGGTLVISNGILTSSQIVGGSLILNGTPPPPNNILADDAIVKSSDATKSSPSVKKAGKVLSSGPRTFRFREQASQSANFVPVTRFDAAWLPARTTNGQREVLLDVLANDRDPDNDPLTIAGIIPPAAGFAAIISTSKGPRLRFSTTEVDPASQLIRYELADGQGGTALGFVAIRSSADGKYTGAATNVANPSSPAALLTIEIGKNNSIKASFTIGNVRYSGQGTLDLDETADLALTANKLAAFNLHLDLQRGTPRQITATVVGANGVYSAVCPQFVKPNK